MTAQENSYECFICRMDTEAVMEHNTLMESITTSRGELMGFVQEDALILNLDNTFELQKELKTTKSNVKLEEPVKVCYTFTGTYERWENTVQLSAALTGKGSVHWGTFSNFFDTGDGEYDSVETPEILCLYPTAFFVENCKNVPMTVQLDISDNTFSFDHFEPIILSLEKSGEIPKKAQQQDPTAGLMEAPLLEDVSGLSLKNYFATQGMFIGTIISPSYLCDPYVDIIMSQFNSITLENHLKPLNTLSQEKSQKTGHLSVSFSTETVTLLNWCKENKMPVHGHTLIWHLGTAEWIYHEGFADDAPNVDRKEMLCRMEDYIISFFKELKDGGWSDNLYCLDVINEAIVSPDSLRQNPWREIIGDDYIWHAYHFARKHAPKNIRLTYNDYDMEAKTDKVIALVESLVDEDGSRMVDIVGDQGHFNIYIGVDRSFEYLERIWKETNCEIQITELDVSISRKGTQDELKLQGRFYYNFVQKLLALRHKGVNITGVTLWGFADSLSWMPAFSMNLYDRNLVPKYAYFGMLGMKQYAGYDDDIEIKQTISRQIKFAVPTDPCRYVYLMEDGTFLDTTTGIEIHGTYIFDGDFTYMLIPKAGGHISLHLSIDENSAKRIESAGELLEIVRVV